MSRCFLRGCRVVGGPPGIGGVPDILHNVAAGVVEAGPADGAGEDAGLGGGELVEGGVLGFLDVGLYVLDGGDGVFALEE